MEKPRARVKLARGFTRILTRGKESTESMAKVLAIQSVFICGNPRPKGFSLRPAAKLHLQESDKQPPVRLATMPRASPVWLNNTNGRKSWAAGNRLFCRDLILTGFQACARPWERACAWRASCGSCISAASLFPVISW